MSMSEETAKESLGFSGTPRDTGLFRSPPTKQELEAPTSTFAQFIGCDHLVGHRWSRSAKLICGNDPSPGWKKRATGELAALVRMRRHPVREDPPIPAPRSSRRTRG